MLVKSHPMYRRIALILLFLAADVRAVAVTGLYRAEVDVADHSAGQLQVATRRGFAQVLVKVSGRRAVLGTDEVRQALDDSRSYMQKYQYRRRPDGLLGLQIHYDSKLVSDLLTKAQIPLWPSNRPPVLVWIVVDDPTDRRFVTRESDPQKVDLLQREFERRGVPMMFPLLDLDDMAQLPLYDLWELDPSSILRASRRYRVDNILAIRLDGLSAIGWQGDWLLLRDEGDVFDSFGRSPLADIYRDGIDFVAGDMVARYAVSAESSVASRIYIHIEGVGSYLQYRELVEFLQSVELVETVRPAKIGDDSMLLALSSQAGAEQLGRILALEQRLRRQGEPPPDSAGPRPELAYRWIPRLAEGR